MLKHPVDVVHLFACSRFLSPTLKMSIFWKKFDRFKDHLRAFSIFRIKRIEKSVDSFKSSKKKHQKLQNFREKTSKKVANIESSRRKRSSNSGNKTQFNISFLSLTPSTHYWDQFIIRGVFLYNYLYSRLWLIQPPWYRTKMVVLSEVLHYPTVFYVVKREPGLEKVVVIRGWLY